ncbi:hypothetical protein WICPIJ_005077 [Wickerhamomyces pijperi]|uniref:TATA element modulatory factor 1 TATA binding domain-containing protein n=1 Tax=Wickerhamomyces pijperi TaxID=599730 RepID=A0A9P8TMA0_WICPI|nr:hypothetical protein WICPIJ_005077 [Wickerhamomyces pijperi]
MAKKKGSAHKNPKAETVQTTTVDTSSDAVETVESQIEENEPEQANTDAVEDEQLIETKQDTSVETIEAPSEGIIEQSPAVTESDPQLADPIEQEQETKPETIITTNATPEPIPEPIQSPTTEEQEPVSVAKPAVVKKRLTLQERLALAAKSGKSKRTASSSSSTPSASAKRVVSPQPPAVISSPVSDVPDEPLSPSVSASISEVLDPAVQSTESKDLEPTNTVSEGNDLSVEGLLRALKTVEAQNASLNKENQQLKKKLETGSNSQQKDQIIEQLMKEGEALSKKELDLNEFVKKLKSKDSDSEYQIKSLRNSIEILNTEKKQLKESVKKIQDKETTLSNKTKALQLQLDNETRSLHDEINKNSVLSEKADALNRELSEERIAFQKEKMALTRKIESGKIELSNAKEDHIREVKRLEEKIEQLRFQLENDQTLVASKPDEAYLKLTRQHETLQKQYTTATENWQGIESMLMKKLQSLERQTDSIKMQELKISNENQVLTQELNTKIQETQDLQSKLNESTREIETLSFKLSTVTTQLNDLETKHSADTLRLSQEKATLQNKLQESEKARRAQEQIQPQTLYASNQTYGDFPSPRPFFAQGRSSSASSLKFKFNTPTTSNNNNNWETNFKDIGFGESSTTPMTSRKPSGVNISNTSHSASMEMLSDFEEEYDDGEVSTSFNKSFNGSGGGAGNGSVISGSGITGTGTGTGAGTSVGGGGAGAGAGGASVQMLGKLSNQVRRLEIELSSMKEELDHASEEKKSAAEEIVKLMKDNEQVQSYKARIEELSKDVELYSSKYERSLEILGEKSELVEELRADIADLKDLLRSQVQQMIELQEKVNR